LIAFGLFVLVSLIWIALGWTPGHQLRWWQSNLDWWEGGTAIGALAIGGLIVGRGEPDGVSANLGAAVMWALSTLGGLLLALPLLVHRLTTPASAHVVSFAAPALWVTFGALAIGLALSLMTSAAAVAADKAKPYLAGRSGPRTASTAAGSVTAGTPAQRRGSEQEHAWSDNRS
jgi:hypothetical protein